MEESVTVSLSSELIVSQIFLTTRKPQITFLSLNPLYFKSLLRSASEGLCPSGFEPQSDSDAQITPNEKLYEQKENVLFKIVYSN